MEVAHRNEPFILSSLVGSRVQNVSKCQVDMDQLSDKD
jgi:hypothetical protein